MLFADPTIAPQIQLNLMQIKRNENKKTLTQIVYVAATEFMQMSKRISTHLQPCIYTEIHSKISAALSIKTLCSELDY